MSFIVNNFEQICGHPIKVFPAVSKTHVECLRVRSEAVKLFSDCLTAASGGKQGRALESEEGGRPSLIVSKRPTTDNNKAKLFENYLDLVQIKIIGRLDQ